MNFYSENKNKNNENKKSAPEIEVNDHEKWPNWEK